MPNPSPTHTFDLGLVMAGAISAGAYTAGVIDFLIQALDAWQAAKTDPATPTLRHNVNLRVMSGASAGGMTSAIASVALMSEIDPVTDPDHPPPPRRNRLYDAWVRQIDISKLLGTADIERTGKVVSLLDSSALETIALQALEADYLKEKRAYVDDPLAVMLTVANLRGVPYGFRLYSSRDFEYGMYEHKDHMRFAVSWQGLEPPGARLLARSTAPHGIWPQLATAALASGAFPGGLAPRLLERRWDDFNGRYGRNPIWKGIAPSYKFLCVDGGLMDNEPLELARTHLLAPGQSRNPREGDKARRAVIMIDPFPNSVSFEEEYEPDESLTTVASKMFAALIDQARFKPEELDLAEDDSVYSRFMISPSRRNAMSQPVEPAMASAILGGFGGFFHESFRRHDFQLGRRNCQAFLRRHFCLPETNDLFDGTTDPTVRREHYVRDANNAVEMFKAADGTESPFLPIIPLIGAAAAEVPPMPAPSGAAVNLPALTKMVAKRVDKVGATMIRSDLKDVFGGVVRWILEKSWSWHLASSVTDKAIKTIEKELGKL